MEPKTDSEGLRVTSNPLKVKRTEVESKYGEPKKRKKA